MFTGIAHDKYRVSKTLQEDGVCSLAIDLDAYAQGLQLGASVAINGVCLTVVAVDDSVATFEVGQETARISNLGQLADRGFVNVERSYRVGDEVGGHLLSGHIADVAKTVGMSYSGSEALLEFEVPDQWRMYLMPKGFVALNGCSLTIAEYDRKTGLGSVNLIPETLRRTTFSDVKAGDLLNLEVDAQTQTIVDTVRALLLDGEYVRDLGQQP